MMTCVLQMRKLGFRELNDLSVLALILAGKW